MNLLVLNLGMDVDDTVLGFTTSWVNALARRSSHVSVIAHSRGRVEVEPNVTVHSLGKERGWSEPRRVAQFYRLVRQVMRDQPIDACFAHMAPMFAALYAPVARARGVPILLWYAHAAVPLSLRVAHALVDRSVTAAESAYGLPGPKLFVLGHGVDMDVFRPPPPERPPDYERTVLSIGRVSRVKRIDELLSALAVTRERHGADLRLELVGGMLTEDDAAYVAFLRDHVRSLGLTEAVDFAGGVPFAEVPARYHRGFLFAHLTDTSLDKALLESMASACVTVSTNATFRSMVADEGLGWLAPDGGSEALADCIARAAALSSAERASIGNRLRGIVERRHSLDVLADKLVAHLTELRALRGRSGRALRWRR